MSDATRHNGDAPRRKKGKPAPSRGSKPGELRGCAGKGRAKGVPNKATKKCREAIAMIADDMSDQFVLWLQATANGDPDVDRKPDPKGAAQLYLQAIEYHIPKLARAEVTGRDGGPVVIVASPLDEEL